MTTETDIKYAYDVDTIHINNGVAIHGKDTCELDEAEIEHLLDYVMRECMIVVDMLVAIVVTDEDGDTQWFLAGEDF